MVTVGSKKLRYAYFPGCSSKSSSIEYHISTKNLAEELGIELIELVEANCCGTHAIEDYNEKTWLSLNARNLSLAEKLGLDILTICSSCFLNTKKANKMIKEKPEVKEEVNHVLNKIGREYNGNVRVKHILGVLVNDYGLENLEKKIKRELDIRVAPYYGCQILRPPEIVNFDDPEQPKTFERLIEAIGCEVADFPEKIDCCGAPLTLVEPKLHWEMVKKILKGVEKTKADCIATVCPLCHFALDSNQLVFGLESKIPVLHVTQLVGIAVGLPSNKLALDKNLVSTKKLADKCHL